MSKKINSLFIILFPLFLICLICAVGFSLYISQQIYSKNLEIAKLKEIEKKHLARYELLDKNIKKINNFIYSLNKYDRFIAIDFNLNTTNESTITEKNYKLVLDNTTRNLKKINLAMVDKIINITNKQKQLGLDENIKPVSYEEEFNKYYDSDIEDKESVVLSNVLDKNIKLLNRLEDFINEMPFSQPMEFTRITSHFGVRNDPFTGTAKEHHGIDLVGSHLSDIYATAPGKVIFVGNKTGYGKTVIIEHKNNFKTLFGHLHSAKVNIGDNVKRGDVIGVQGNTGRSTGAHLHYEIFKDNKRFNPINFLTVGNNFFLN